MKLGKVATVTFNVLKRRALSKLNRLKKQGYDVSEYLNFDIKATAKNNQFTSIKDYNAWKKAVKEFTNRNNSDFKVVKNKHGVKTLGIIKKDYEKKQRKAVKDAKQRLKELDEMRIETIDGTITAKEERALLKEKEHYKIPSVIDFKDVPTKTIFNQRMIDAEKRARDNYFEERDSQMKDNWIKLMRTAFGDDSDELIDIVEKMVTRDFLEFYYLNHDVSKFALYDSEDGYAGSNASIYEDLLQGAKRYKAGENLKGFK